MAGLTRADLTTIATRTGKKVVAAWSSRNEGAMGTVYGVVLHHTGSAWGTAVAPTLGIVQNGRSDLQNALCTFYIDRAGAIYLITEKVAWHAGQGSYRGITDGNGHLLGIEAESDGVHWTDATVDSYVALVAEICRYLGADVDTWAIRHATWATPKGRKTDFAGLNETDFKMRVKARLNGTPTEDDMPLTQADADLVATAVVTRALHSANDKRGDWGLIDRLPSVDVTGQDTNAAVKAVLAAVKALQSAPTAAVNVDASAVATALAGNSAFVAALAKAVNDDAAKRLAS